MKSIATIATIATMLVALIVLGFGGYLLWTHISANHALVAAQVQAGKATVSAGQAQAEQAAQQVVISGEAHNHLDIAVHQENANAIAAAPVADAPIDPVLIADANRGLCRYATDAASAGCAGLQQDHPPVLAPADPFGGAAVGH